MAYGNWGAFAFMNGEHRPEREDNTPYSENNLQPGCWQAFGGNDEAGNRLTTGKAIGVHHVTLGSGAVRLCGYKCYPVMFINGDPVDLEPYQMKPEDGDDQEWHGEIDGFKFSAAQFDGNMVDLKLVEPDGTVWFSRCGHEFGAGHMGTDEAGFMDAGDAAMAQP